MTGAFNIALANAALQSQIQRDKFLSPHCRLSFISTLKAPTIAEPKTGFKKLTEEHRPSSRGEFELDTETKSIANTESVVQVSNPIRDKTTWSVLLQSLIQTVMQTQELKADVHQEQSEHMELVAWKRTEIEKKKQSFLSQRGKLRSRTKKMINCNCGYNREEGEMVHTEKASTKVLLD